VALVESARSSALPHVRGTDVVQQQQAIIAFDVDDDAKKPIIQA